MEEAATPPGSVIPSPSVRAELVEILMADGTLLGEVFRRTEAGETAADIQAARGATRDRFVWNYQRLIRTLLEGELPSSPSVAGSQARRFRSWLRALTLSPETERYLLANLAVLERTAASLPARLAEDQEGKKATAVAEAQATPGIYVYALPHYIRYPYDEESGRTLLKVGRSDRSVDSAVP